MTPEQQAQTLIDDGWFQTSRRHRMVARLPKGETGKAALFDAEMKGYRGLEGTYDEHWWAGQTREWVRHMDEASCAGHFMRCHASGDLAQTLDKRTFDAFRRLGGRTAR